MFEELDLWIGELFGKIFAKPDTLFSDEPDHCPPTIGCPPPETSVQVACIN